VYRKRVGTSQKNAQKGGGGSVDAQEATKDFKKKKTRVEKSRTTWRGVGKKRRWAPQNELKEGRRNCRERKITAVGLMEEKKAS